MRVSWTAKKTNESVLNKAGVKREPLDIVKARTGADPGVQFKGGHMASAEREPIMGV